MSFQDIISNTWSDAEVQIIVNNPELTIGQLAEKLTMAGFARTFKAIEKKRAKMFKRLLEKNNKEKEIIVEKPIETSKTVWEPLPITENLLPDGYVAVVKKTKLRQARTPGKTMTSLVIPDAHAKPGDDFVRFMKLGQLIVERRPANIILMGDFVTLESLSAWDLGKAGKMEGKRYSEDCKAGIKAIMLMLAPLRELQKKEDYNPRIIYIIGNHEDRLARYVSTKPELAEHLEISKDLRLEELGFTDVIPYRGFVEIEGTLFTHAVMNAANQAIGGKTALAAISQSVSKSIVIGHLHRLETVNHYRHGADDIIQIVSTGCFFDGVEEYADGGLNAYWRGVLLLDHYKQGRFDIETISTDRLMELY